MATTFSVGPDQGDDELGKFRAIMGEAFAVPPDRCRQYVELAGRQNIRVVRIDGTVAGGLAVLPKGQWFGGRAVPMAGIAAVAIAPEYRARGAATVLLNETLAELHAAGTPISTLYPATLALYRRVGYEAAGLHIDVTLPAKAIDIRDRSLDVRPATEADESAIQDVYARYAAATAGNLQRTKFHWARVRDVRGEPAQGYVVTRGGALEGYAYVLSQPVAERRYDLRVSDLAALTPEAARRLLTFLADFRTIRDQVRFWSGPADPMLLHLAEFAYKAECATPWMLRMVDVSAALEARGYPRGIVAEAHLAVRDDVLPRNSGKYVLSVADGRGHVRKGGQGAVDLHIRGLAALYSGLYTPGDVVLAGLGQGKSADVAGLAGVFAGPTPWMRDEF